MKHASPMTLSMRVRIVLSPILRSPRFLITLALIGGVVGVLYGLDLADRYATLDGTKLPVWFSLSNEGALGELFEYTLTTLAAIALGIRAWRRSAPFLGALAGLFAWMTLDNALALHELFGGEVARVAGALIPDVRAQDSSELLVFIASGVLWLALLVATGSRDRWRSIVEGTAVALLVMGAAAFGVGFDLLHAMLHDGSPVVEQALGFVEDGGELGFLALAAAFALSLPGRSACFDRRSKWLGPERRRGGDARVADRRGLA